MAECGGRGIIIMGGLELRALGRVGMSTIAETCRAVARVSSICSSILNNFFSTKQGVIVLDGRCDLSSNVHVLGYSSLPIYHILPIVAFHGFAKFPNITLVMV